MQYYPITSGTSGRRYRPDTIMGAVSLNAKILCELNGRPENET